MVTMNKSIAQPFYTLFVRAETALKKGTSAICTLAEIGQRFIINLCNSNDATFNAKAKECTPKHCGKSDENTERGMKDNKGWTKPTKHAPITCFYKKHDKSNENDKNNDNRCDVFTEDMEFENEKYEEELAKIIIEEKENDVEKSLKNNKKNKSFRGGK